MWTDAVDDALRGWLAEAGTGGVLAVVALGGYARRELCPRSDVDLLLLHDGWGRRDLESLVRALCYPLWDAGLSIGHAVRTPREALRAAGERLETATALTDRRLVAGDRGLLDDLAGRCRRWLRRAGADLLVAVDGDGGGAGDGAGMLEPDLKSGAGGLRHLHALRWASAVVLGEPGLDPLVGARYLGAAERAELARAADTLLAARCALHLVARGDRLRLDLQDEVAARLGLPGGDELLRRVGLAMRTVAHVHGRTWPRLVADARGGRRRRRPAPEPLDDGITLVDGLVEVDPVRTLAADPSLGLRAVAAAAARATHLGRATTTALRRQVGDLGRVGWDDAARAALLATLRAGDDARAALADADHTGLLGAHLPEWPSVRGHPQRNPFHRYDLDTHAAQTCAQLARIADGALDAAHGELWDELDEPDTLVLGAWLHDVGKAWPGDHSAAGGQVAQRWVRHMGFEHARAERVARLVRLHLLLPDAATGIDLDDEGELRAVAHQVGDSETLDGLYLLSLADARATGPAAWSAWKDGLLAELHARLRRLLTGTAAQPRERRPAAVVEAARRLARDPAAVEALLERAPARYLRAADPEQLVAHADLLRPLPGAGQLRGQVRPGPAAGTETLSLVAGDRRGLIADCAGVLAARGVTVLDARAFTGADGVALDWFVVRPGERPDWPRILHDLRGAAAGRLDVAAMVDRREQRRDARQLTLPGPLPVTVRFDAGARSARVEVRAPDAPGLLYRLARSLADSGLDVTGARVATLGPEVRDVFQVRLPDPPPDAGLVEARLRAAVATHGPSRDRARLRS
ncbi:MAG TPA: [protein-PII] uridylyltransferase [Egibacteraceae bacterium]|nr:[protein-PII] uridylyltransferase [Egibacteraceae bacterium]